MVHACRSLLCLLITALAAAAALADEPGSCIAGTVVNASTGEPLRRAAVNIPQTAALTDAAGAFRFCDLPAGAYFVHAEKPGFVADGDLVRVGPSRNDVVLRLNPLATVAGTVTNSAGEPLENVRIEALAVRIMEGHTQARLAVSAITDDKGFYRLPGLEAGLYNVRAAGLQNKASEGFAPVYHGGARDLAAASPVNLQPGQSLDADFSVTPGPAFCIRGTVTGFAPLAPLEIELFGENQEPMGVPVTVDTKSGIFEIRSVVAGTYTLRATQVEAGTRRRCELPLQVSNDVQAVVLPLHGGAVLRGIVRTSASSAPSCMIQLWPAEPWAGADSGQATDQAGEFIFDDVLPGRYRLRILCPNGYVAAAQMGDIDLLANSQLRITSGTQPLPIEITLASDGGTLEVEASGPAWVRLRPVDGCPFHWRVAHLDRQVRLSSLAPGDYLVYAWKGTADAFEFGNPESAASVHIGPGGHETVKVTVQVAGAP